MSKDKKFEDVVKKKFELIHKTMQRLINSDTENQKATLLALDMFSEMICAAQKSAEAIQLSFKKAKENNQVH